MLFFKRLYDGGAVVSVCVRAGTCVIYNDDFRLCGRKILRGNTFQTAHKIRLAVVHWNAYRNKRF